MSAGEIKIDGRPIGEGQPPYVIAELSANHNGDLGRALAIVDACAAAGVDAVKLQTYTADTITLDSDRPEFLISGGLWDGKRLYDLYAEAHTPWEWHRELFERAKELGVTMFSSPFDETAVDFLEELGAPAYKIASFELVDLPLIERVAATKKPLIISTGMASKDEITAAVDAARGAGCEQLALLHCVSGYPTPVDEANLSSIVDLRARFGVVSGFSDHTLGLEVSVAAVALGASLLEKHVTLHRADGGPDAAFSLQPEELAELVRVSKAVYAATSSPPAYLDQRAVSEIENRRFRPSLYVVADISAGEAFTRQNVRSVRPSVGLRPGMLKDVIGRRAKSAISAGEPLSADHIA